MVGSELCVKKNWALIAFSIDPELSIVEGEEKFVEIGSNLNLTCIIKQMPPKEDPENLQLKWTRNDQVASKFALIEMFFAFN